MRAYLDGHDSGKRGVTVIHTTASVQAVTLRAVVCGMCLYIVKCVRLGAYANYSYEIYIIYGTSRTIPQNLIYLKYIYSDKYRHNKISFIK